MRLDVQAFWQATRSPIRFLAGLSVSDWRWSSWLVLAVQLTVVGLLFRAWVGPWILRAVLRRVSVRSISPRSVRGIRIRTGRMTVRLDRIGLSYHRPSAETARRFSVQVQGLCIELHEIQCKTEVPSRNLHSASSIPFRRFRRRPTLSDFRPSPLWRRFWSFYSYMYESLAPYVRPLFRTVFVTSSRMVIRCLPALTHIIDFELDRLLVILPGFPEAHLAIHSATLSTTVSFTNLENVITMDSSDAPSQRVHQGFLNMMHFKARFGGSARRIWDRAWGRTQGAATFELKIGKTSLYANDTKWSLSQRSLNADQESSPQFVASNFNFVTSQQHENAVCVRLPAMTAFIVSFKFGPKRGIIESHSVEMALNVKSVHVAVDALVYVFRDVQAKTTKRKDSFPTPSVLSSRVIAGNPATCVEGSSWKRMRKKNNGFSSATLLRSCGIHVNAVKLQFMPWYTCKQASRRYTADVKDIEFEFCLTKPDTNELHHRHLGGRSTYDPDWEAPAYSMGTSIQEILIQRHDAREEQNCMSVVSIGNVRLDSLVSQWPRPIFPSPPMMSGDPNASRLILRLEINAPQFCERMDVLHDMLTNVHSSNSGPLGAPPRRILNFVPRLHIELAVHDIAACIILPYERTESPASVILSSTQASISFASYFKSVPARLQEFSGCNSEYAPVEMVCKGNAILGPAFITHLHSPLALEGSHRVPKYMQSPSVSGEPLLSMGMLEVQLDAAVLGGMFSDSDSVSLDIGSAMVNVSFVTDAISMELWQPNAVGTLGKLIDFFEQIPRSPPTDGRLSATNSIPFSLFMHIGISQLIILVTGKDLNPDENLGLSRGIALQSCLSFQFGTFEGRGHFTRMRRQFSWSHARQKLLLPEDLITEAISLSNTQTPKEGRVSLLRIRPRNTALRTAVATDFAADRAYEDDDGPSELKSAEFIWMRQGQIDALMRWDVSHSNNATRQLQLIVKIPYLYAHLKVLHAYCTLLAAGTIQSLFRVTLKDNRLDSDSSVVVMKASIDTIQALADFPLQERICFRSNNLSFRYAKRDPIVIEWGTFFVWVPSSRCIGKWEELLRFRSWKIVCQINSSESITIAVEGEGARLRIPFEYIVADLILDISIAFKACRHLFHIISSGRYSHFHVPPPEGAKLAPVVNVKLTSFSVEAGDDPLESRLGLAWRCGVEAAKTRQEREDAFEAKVAAIACFEGQTQHDSRFSAQHSVSVEEARQRLLQVHSISWVTSHNEFRDRQRRNEERTRRQILVDHSHFTGIDIAPLVDVQPLSRSPPLVRVIINGLSLSITQPLFKNGDLSDFLLDVGKGLPRNTRFTLLIPLHLNLSLGSASVSLRDYPLPILHIPPAERGMAVGFDSDLVIAEEIGTLSSVLWKECIIVPSGSGSSATRVFSLSVPKTTMPVKTYANPSVDVVTQSVTEFCWGISYNPAIQDVMRVLDTFTTPPPDPSPVLGFWDKIRLMLHWRVKFRFDGEVQLNLKGSRDPYSIDGIGAGFAFRWNGNTEMTIGCDNSDDELLQLTSDTLLIVIPEFDRNEHAVASNFYTSPSMINSRGGDIGTSAFSKAYKKICANFANGIHWGIGFKLERTCNEGCSACSGKYSCRNFSFKPHYDVQLEPKSCVPREKSLDDSYNGFRSDFIHLSTSLTSSNRCKDTRAAAGPSSFYLTPKMFSHFWSWWDLFDRFLGIPIRQGSQFPNARPPSRKFGQHLATIKYRFSINQLFISHVYVDDSKDAWSEGLTNFIGIKALVDLFEADMHQREQEATVPDSEKTTRHKPFYAADVRFIGLQMKAMLAMFSDPLKQHVSVDSSPFQSRFTFAKEDLESELPKGWVDMCDFKEIDWTPEDSDPLITLLPIASCPRFSYFRRTGGPHGGLSAERSRFGDEDTHKCVMGNEPSLHQVQIDLVNMRIETLKNDLRHLHHVRVSANRSDEEFKGRDASLDMAKKIKQLEQYVSILKDNDVDARPGMEHSSTYSNYLMPSDIVCPADWTEFDNVYQCHQPKVFLTNSTRDILLQYYHCSRSRRGFEYHMATRAVRFIRDQANTLFMPVSNEEMNKRHKKATSSAQIAASALKRMLVGEEDSFCRTAASEHDLSFDPMDGWSEGIAVRKSHFCLLLKPQFVLKSGVSDDAICVLAALQASLQSFAILDSANAEDPVSGRIMTRNHAMLTGLQSFAPSERCHMTTDGVPLEVLIDLRADSDEFDRLVPQTDAIFRYDKFNRLRLRSNISSVVSGEGSKANDHLQHQMDLIDVRMPKFSVMAGSKNFQTISNIITKLLLFSDAVHKQRSAAVVTLFYKYDFTDLSSAASVVEGFQSRLRRAVEREQLLGNHLAYDDDGMRLDVLQTKAHVILLAEELGLIFDAIKLAQDKADEKNADKKSALKLHASSTEISWGMVDNSRDMLVKLGVRGIDFSWLSRQDGSTVNKLQIGDLQAFDGSPEAEWPEIIVKYKEPSNHPLVKRGVFAQADWTVLAPVGGITIFESFFLQLHPMRLQLEARVGKSIMEYIFPGRRERKTINNHNLDLHLKEKMDRDDTRSTSDLFQNALVTHSDPLVIQRSSAEVPRTPNTRYSEENRFLASTNSAARLSVTRSFSDLRQASRQNSVQIIEKQSPYLLADRPSTANIDEFATMGAEKHLSIHNERQKTQDDATEMKTRSAQNTFVLVKISSMNILLSFRKDGSFFCRDARIRTRELVIRNQTWSFEELMNQFIPSEPTWRGWMKVAFHQPLVPVLPVAKELFSKTKWIAGKGKANKLIKRQHERSFASPESNANGKPGSRVVSGPSTYPASAQTQSSSTMNLFKHLKKISDTKEKEDGNDVKYE